MKSRRWMTWRLLAALVLAGLVGGLWWWHYRGQSALERYEARLIAAGEKLQIAELIPPPVPAEQDGSPIFAQARSKIWFTGLLNTNPPPMMRGVSPGTALVGWQQADLRDAEATNTWAEVREELAVRSNAVELLEQLIARPVVDEQLDYALGFNLRVPRLTDRKQAVQLLGATVLGALHEGDSPRATRALRSMLAVTKCSAAEPLVISQLVRMAMATIAINTTWEWLQSPEVTEADLAAVQRDWEEMEFAASGARAVAMERNMGLLAALQMRRSGAVFQQMAAPMGLPGAGAPAPGADDVWETVKASLVRVRGTATHAAWRIAWADPDQLTALKGHQAVLETLRQMATNAPFLPVVQTLDTNLFELGITADKGDETFLAKLFGEHDPRTLLSEGVAGIARIPNRCLRIEAARRLATAAIALKRHQLKYRDWPNDLSALSPDFRPQRLSDPGDGQPLRYRVNPDGTFLLYCIGDDGVDDGGDPRPKNLESKSKLWLQGRDWVWPRPAAAATANADLKSH